ncbi:MAG: S1 family peptidase [Acidimicrobiales bacterium]
MSASSGRRRNRLRSAVPLAIGTLAVGLASCASAAAVPEDFVYRARIDDCRITTPQLATIFRISDRLLVSAAHPFEGIRSFEVLDVNGDSIEADLVALRPEKDVALLWLQEPQDSGAVALASQPVEPDTPVEIVTFDREGALVIQAGRAVRLANVTLDGEDPRQGIELQADIEAGDSGAPVLFDDRVVGVVFASSRGRESGWAVSAAEVNSLVATLPDQPVPLVLGCGAG